MQEYSPFLMVSVLRKDYPEIAEQISARIKKSLPEERLTDLSKVDLIIASFKKELEISAECWTNIKGSTRITQKRDLLIGVLLLFYNPEKLLRLVDQRTFCGLFIRASKIIGTSRAILSMTAPNVILAFRAYEEFRNEVYRLYDLIKTENKFFE
jgi:hypothetical protein